MKLTCKLFLIGLSNAINPNQEITSNLMDVLSKEVDKLKQECEYRQKQLDQRNKVSQMKEGNYMTKEIQEEKVTTNYLSQNNDRVQAFKHVSTQNKPEYNSLEDLQKEKEMHMRRLKESEKKYETMKTSNQEKPDFFKFGGGSKISLDNDLEHTEPSVNIDSKC